MHRSSLADGLPRRLDGRATPWHWQACQRWGVAFFVARLEQGGSNRENGPLLTRQGKLMATTLENLQAAFNGESNARAKYLIFAEKADEEGYGQVASLFRAAAAAEAIHAAAHARVIKKMGGEAQAVIGQVTPAGTPENLLVAIKGETYERDVMYPQFIAAAKAEGNKAAVVSFENALLAEAEHARMYQAAHDHLNQWKSGKRDFWICQVCGYTLDQAPVARCPACGAPPHKFTLVN
jgi:rubrerythrin